MIFVMIFVIFIIIFNTCIIPADHITTGSLSSGYNTAINTISANSVQGQSTDMTLTFRHVYGSIVDLVALCMLHDNALFHGDSASALLSSRHLCPIKNNDEKEVIITHYCCYLLLL